MLNSPRWVLPIAPVVAALVIAACGGGGGGGGGGAGAGNSAGAGNPQPVSAAVVSTTTTTTLPASAVTTTLSIDSQSASSQRNLPVTFGQVFAEGEVAASDALTGRLSDGSALGIQVDAKARHADGSLRHAIISAVLPQLDAGQTLSIGLAKTNTYASVPPATALSELLDGGFTASVNLTIAGQVYRASADSQLRSGSATSWLSGPLVTEWLVSAPLKTDGGVTHPHLIARFAIRSYAGLKQARVDVTIENNWAYEPNPQNVIYDAQVLVGGSEVYARAGLTHYHHARWRKIFWWGGTPAAHVRHEPGYLISTRAVPSYDKSLAISSAGLTTLDTNWAGKNTGPMGAGVLVTAMGTTGGRPDIGPMPQWSAMYLLSMDKRAKAVTLGTGDLAGSWSIHYRDKNTDLPVSLTDYPYMTLLGTAGDAVNPVTKKSEKFPSCGGDCSTVFTPDSAHQPSMAYLPYLTTGDYFYLEELQFWANWNALRGNPYYRGFTKGLVQWDEVRGQAWSLRTLGQTAYITPDDHPLKSYFVNQLGQNLAWYNTTYTAGNPNQLGFIDGSGQYAFNAYAYTSWAGPQTGIAPWQDDFFTWSVGHLAELGFSDARSLLAWKAKFPVGRMTAAGYCWTDAAAYTLVARPASSLPAYASFAEAYLATMRNSDGTALGIASGLKYLDQACASQAQADWRTAYDRENSIAANPWLAGQMQGYSTSPYGYPSNLQPALAVAKTFGVANADSAWSIFINRAAKPDYTSEPQWAVVPR